MKKILLLFCLILSIGTVMISCGDTAGKTENPAESGSENTTASAADLTAAETTEAAPVYADDDLGEYNFDGYVFRLLSRESGYINLEELTGDVLNDAIYNRNRKIEERFNFKITEKLLSGADMGPARASLLAGDNSYDMMIIRCPDAFTYAQQGLIHSINDLPNINLDKPYWDKWLTGQWTIANKMFFASSALDLPAYTHTVALLFNKQLAKDLGLEDLYALVNDGKWTFDKFAEFAVAAKKDLNGDGVLDENDRQGYLATLRMIPPDFWIAGGVKTIEKNGDDIPELTANSEKFLNVYNKIVETTITSGAWYQAKKPDELNDPLLLEMFKNGQALFYDSTFGGIPNLRDMEIDFGILPYPKYDESQTQYYTRLGWAELMCVPLYCDQQALDRTSVILEALACESAKSVVPVYYGLALKTKHTRDEDSAAMIDILFNTRVFDFGDTIWSADLRDGLFAKIFQKKSDTLVSQLEKVAPKLQKTIDQTVAAFTALK